MCPNGLFVSAWILCSRAGHGCVFLARWHVRLVRPFVASLPGQAWHSITHFVRDAGGLGVGAVQLELQQPNQSWMG